MKYFDYASTTDIHPEVLKTYNQLLSKHYANVDSLHDLGQEGSRLMERSRAQIAQLLSISKEEIIFTSGASEANSMAIKGCAFAYQHKGKHLITSLAEHSSVLHAFEQLEKYFGFEVTYLKLTKEGIVDLQELQKALKEDTILVSLMFVNNEIGSIHPIQEIAKIIQKYSRAKFHVDCVQALGKLDLPLQEVDFATMSAHKIYGLKGSGILYKKKNTKCLPLINGGQQEYGLRGGTSNAIVNIMFAKTLRLALEDQTNMYIHCQKLNYEIRDILDKIPGAHINSPSNGVPHILNVSFDQVGSEIMLNALNQRGFCVSAQSTCSSKSKNASYVLQAMGYDLHRSTHAIRISLSHQTKKEDVMQLIDTIKEIIKEYGTNERS